MGFRRRRWIFVEPPLTNNGPGVNFCIIAGLSVDHLSGVSAIMSPPTDLPPSRVPQLTAPNGPFVPLAEKFPLSASSTFLPGNPSYDPVTQTGIKLLVVPAPFRLRHHLDHSPRRLGRSFFRLPNSSHSAPAGPPSRPLRVVSSVFSRTMMKDHSSLEFRKSSPASWFHILFLRCGNLSLLATPLEGSFGVGGFFLFLSLCCLNPQAVDGVQVTGSLLFFPP